jgi:ATP-binding cassette subfamily B protein
MESAAKKPTRKADTGAVLRAYTRALSRYPYLLPLPFLGALIIQAGALGAPIYMQRFINLLAASATSPDIQRAAFFLIAMFALMNGIGWIGRRVQMFSHQVLETRVMGDLSDEAFGHLLKHGHSFFISNFTGTLTRRVNRYARSFEQIFDIFVFNFFSTFIFAAGVMVVLGRRSLLLALALLLWMVIFISLQVLMARIRQPLRLASSEADSKVGGILSDAVSNHSTILMFGSIAWERSLYGAAVRTWRKATLRSWNADEYIFAVQGLFAILIEVVLLGGGVLLWERGLITVGDFLLIQVYIIGLMDRVWNLGNSFRRMYQAFADAYEMVQIFETPYEVQDAPNATALAVPKGSIEMRDVSFSFTELSAVLTDFNLEVLPGEKIALVGPSGAGKSTITKLLLRFHDVTSGSIRIDGVDIREVTQDSLHQAIAFVPQEPILFHRSLMDNIRYGRQEATDEEVVEAAKKARCHEFIAALPEGYDTHVGERGVKLSGGERQRVAIARAILKDAPILILDEATSALDSESEHLIQDALKILMEGKTVIVIAHRLSTIMSMDRIIVIEQGKIAAQGTHAELLDQKGGLYHKLWSIQAGSFLTDEGKR